MAAVVNSSCTMYNEKSYSVSDVFFFVSCPGYDIDALFCFFILLFTPLIGYLYNRFSCFRQIFRCGSFSIGLPLKLLFWFNAIHLRCRSYPSDLVISIVDFKKILLDFSLLGAGWYSWSGCLLSFACAVF